MRLAADVGGTFTDLILEDEEGRITIHKAPTTPDDPAEGLLAAVASAAEARGMTARALLAATDTFIHGTTRAINAILTGTTARTALLTTEGHRDILLLREGGRMNPYDNDQEFPEPYIPRRLTFEVGERIGAAGEVVRPLDEAGLAVVIERLRSERVEAVAVCLLWSIANPVHEERVGALLAEGLPGVPVTLSHRLNPSIREYRRASAAAIDASLKPLMADHLAGMERRLRKAGLAGRLLMLTSQGGTVPVEDVAAAPIHAVNSGPSMAPVAGRAVARAAAGADTAIVADTGGTSFDVSLVRRGRVPSTRETWIGPPFRGHMTGFPSVDVRSIGAGGGSIVRVERGLLRVGPGSAGAVPGPAAYGRGAGLATITDCAVVLGLLDPEGFLDGTMPLHAGDARAAVEAHVARPLGLDAAEAAAGAMAVLTEAMVAAVARITVYQGIDPAEAVLVASGGAAGFNCVAIARRLGCRQVVVPAFGAALSAAGALMAELSAEASRLLPMRSDAFDRPAVEALLGELAARARAAVGTDAGKPRTQASVEARYPHQAWEIELPVGVADPAALAHAFHDLHRELFAVDDRASPVEFLAWRVRAGMTPPRRGASPVVAAHRRPPPAQVRCVHLAGEGNVQAAVRRLEDLAEDEPLTGPAIVECAFSSVFIEPGAAARRTAGGDLVIDPWGERAQP